METEHRYQVFISYRREGGEVMAQLLYEALSYRGYDPFYDRESLKSGRFDTKIYRTIDECDDVLVVLPAGALDRCINEGDWLGSEITYAMDRKKPIIPVYMPGFVVPEGEALQRLPERIQEFLLYQGHRMDLGHFNSIMGSLVRMLHARPRSVYYIDDPASGVQAFDRLLQQPAFLEAASRETRVRWIDRLLAARLGPALSEMLLNVIRPYLNDQVNLRTAFDYSIQLDERFRFGVEGCDDSKYRRILERLSYKKQYLAGALPQELWVGFTTDLDELDDTLHDERFFFSENLLIDPPEIRALMALPPEQQRDFLARRMKMQFSINHVRLEPQALEIRESGIFARYQLPPQEDSTVSVRLSFQMPHRRGQSSFLVSINEPTYSPHVVFSNPDDVASVRMVPFLNRAVTAKDARLFDGDCEIALEDEWIMPMSGIMFLIEDA